MVSFYTNQEDDGRTINELNMYSSIILKPA